MAELSTEAEPIWPMPLANLSAPTFLMGQDGEALHYCLDQNTKFARNWLQYANAQTHDSQVFDLGEPLTVTSRSVEEVKLKSELL